MYASTNIMDSCTQRSFFQGKHLEHCWVQSAFTFKDDPHATGKKILETALQYCTFRHSQYRSTRHWEAGNMGNSHELPENNWPRWNSMFWQSAKFKTRGKGLDDLFLWLAIYTQPRTCVKPYNFIADKGIPYTYNNYPQIPNFAVSLYGQLFWVTGHFETSAVNDPKMTLNTKRSNIPHMHITTVAESQISIRFTLRPAIFELQAILRQVHRWPPKVTLNTKRSKLPHIPMSPKFQSILLYGKPFLSYRPFWDKCTKWPQNYLKH